MKELVPRSNSDYSNYSYWEERYSQLLTENPKDDLIYDWCIPSNDLFELLLPHLSDFETRKNSNIKVLILGCGNSKLFQNFQTYFPNLTIVNVDYSEALISLMNKRFGGSVINEPLNQNLSASGLYWLLSDIRNMKQFLTTNNFFDIIFDKATLDVFLCDKNEDPWNPSERAKSSINQELSEVSRLLSLGSSSTIQKGGLFLYVTFGLPHFRLPLLGSSNSYWSNISYYELYAKGKQNTTLPYFLYKMQR